MGWKLSFNAKIVTLAAFDAGLRESVLLGGRGGVLDLFFVFSFFNRVNVLRFWYSALDYYFQKCSNFNCTNCATCDEVEVPRLSSNLIEIKFETFQEHFLTKLDFNLFLWADFNDKNV